VLSRKNFAWPRLQVPPIGIDETIYCRREAAHDRSGDLVFNLDEIGRFHSEQLTPENFRPSHLSRQKISEYAAYLDDYVRVC
jgi:hypothetical protein